MKKTISLALAALCLVFGTAFPAWAEGSGAFGIQAGDLIDYGVYEESPITWRVLDAEQTNSGEKGIFLLSDGLLDVGEVAFDESSTLWEGSLAQEWCTEFARQAFSPSELRLIPAVSKDEGEAYLYALSWREVSLREEQVFFLSVIELEQYFGSYSDINKTTVERSSMESYWWLRTPHRYHDDYHGIVLQGNWVHDYLPQSRWSARPCINLTVEDALLLLPSGDEGALGPVQREEREEQGHWKLLVQRENDPFHVTQVTEENGMLRILYSGAEVSDRSRITLLVSGGDGADVQAIRLSEIKAAEGEITISREALSIPEGTRLFLICEECNGPSQTNYAGTPQELTP